MAGQEFHGTKDPATGVYCRRVKAELLIDHLRARHRIAGFVEVRPHCLESAAPDDDVRFTRAVLLVLRQKVLALGNCVFYWLRAVEESVSEIVQRAGR